MPGSDKPSAVDIKAAFQSAREHARAGRIEQARTLCLRLLEGAPTHTETLNLLGIIAAQQGQPAAAEDYFRRAVHGAPRDALSHYNLGLVLQGRGRLDEAAASYRAALSCNPALTDARVNLGNALKERGAYAEALSCYQRVLQERPGDAAAHSNLGNALRALGRLEEAAAALERACALDPGRAEIQCNLGNVYQDQERIEQALAAFRRALALKPDYAQAHCNLGNALLAHGRLDEAVAAYREAVRLQPDYAEAHRYLAMARQHREYDDEIRAMERLVSQTHIGAPQKIQLSFALGKALEDIGRYEQAFAHYAEGNRLQRTRFSYDIEAEARRFAAVARVFDRRLFARHAAAGLDDATPIFIVGMPRSGTSLVEQVLSSHPQVHGAGELFELHAVITAGAGGQTFPENVERLSDRDFTRLGAAYVERLRRHGTARRITDKMPQNFFYIGMIRLMLPQAKIVHCRRDAVDTCLSCFTQLFTDSQGKVGQPFAFDLRELGRYYRLYEELMAHWRAVLPGAVHDIEYEALTGDPETEVRRLLEHCELPWDDACLHFHATDRLVKTASVAQVRRPIYRSSVQRWRRYERELAPLLEALGRSGR